MIKRFNRFELKYIVTLAKMRQLTGAINQMALPDPYSGEAGYPLVSLYYDSPDLECFWSKIEGIKYRRKVRLRIYPENPITHTRDGMVEIKQRISRTVQKRRLKLPIDAGHRLCTTGVVPDGIDDASDLQVASEVAYLQKSLRLVPTCITAYHRVAFMGRPQEPGLRITFDTNVSYRTGELKVNADASNHLILPRNYAIMEVKCNDRVPDWVTSMLAIHNCELHRVSKYCAGIALHQQKSVLNLAMSPVWTGKEQHLWTNC